MCEEYTPYEDEIYTPYDEEIEGLCPSEIDDMIDDPYINLWDYEDETDEEDYYDEGEY